MDSEVKIFIYPRTPTAINNIEIPVFNVVISDNEENNIPEIKLIAGIASKIINPPSKK